MAETVLLENSSESGSGGSQGQPSAEGTTSGQQQQHPTTERPRNSLELKQQQQQVLVDEMDEESPLVLNHGVPSNDVQSNEDSELSSPPPDDGSSGGEQVYADDRMPLPPYVMSPAGVVPMVEHGGYISPGAHPSVVLMTPIQSEGFTSDRESNEPPLQGEELRKQLVTQLEYYFSKENLSSDKYLSSQMDGDHYVPISIVASFNQVKRLTSDVDLIREAVKDSGFLQLDEAGGKVRAVPEKRCVLILREIPKDTPEKDITALFASDKCPNYHTCEFADNDCWYVTFHSEEDTQKAHRHLREEVREFLGHPIRARIKGTTVQRSSGMPKKNRNVTYPIQPVYNGTPQMPFFQQPPGVVPWPPATSPAQYFEATASAGNNFVHFVSPTPQQSFTGPPNRFANVPMFMSEGEPPVGRGRSAATGNRGGSHVDRGHSPRPIPNGDVHTERERVPERGGGGGRGNRGDHYSGGGGGGGGGNRYRGRGDEDQSKKIPRLTKNRRSNGGGAGGDSSDRGQLAPRQQPKSQHKFELAQSNFPPLPTSSEGGGVTASAFPTITQSQSHMTSDDGSRPKVSDIVRGKHLKESSSPAATVATVMAPPTPQQQHPAPNTNNSSTNSSLPSTNVTPSSVVSSSATSSSTTVEKRPLASAPPIQSHPQSQQSGQPPSSSQPQANQNSQQQQHSQQMATTTGTGSNSSVSTPTSSSSSVSSTNNGSGASSTATLAQPVAPTASQVVSSGVAKSSLVSQAPPSSSSPATPTASVSNSNSIASTTSTAPTTVSSAPLGSGNHTPSHQPQTLQQTASQVVAMGIPAAATSTTTSSTSGATVGVGGVQGNQGQTSGGRQPPSQSKAQRPEGKAMSREGKPYNNYNNGGNNKSGGSRYYDRDHGPNKQNYFRNTQVSKTDNRSTQSSNGGRGRFRDRDRERDNRRPGMNNRSQQTKPSPKTTKKNSAPQAPPPAPTSTTPTPNSDTKSSVPANSEPPESTATTTTTTNSNSGSTAGANSASKSERLSYAQMAQKKASLPPPLPKSSTTAGANSTTASSTSQATTPPGTSSGTSASVTSGSQQASTKTVSAPTSPQGQASSGPVPNGSIPSSGGGSLSKQSNSMKTGKSGLSGSSGQLSAASHPALTASKSAPPSPQKEKLAEAVKSS